VLAVAGLLRPEAWLLAGAYWLWLAPTLEGLRAWTLHTALAGVAPFLWMGTDLLTTGDPLFGFTHTTEATASSGRATGASAIVDLPVVTSHVVGRLMCVAVLVGLAAAMRLPRGRLLLAWLLGTTAAATLPVLAGTPLNARYFLASYVLLCIFAAYGAFGSWAGHAGGRRVAGVACGVGLVLQVVLNVGHLRDLRDVGASAISRRDAAKAVLTAGAIPCRPLVVPTQRVRALAAVWTQTRLDNVLDANEYRSRGAYLAGTDAAMRDVATLEGRAGTAAQPPGKARIVRESGGWQLRVWC
jgi:hypothetical protein